MHDLQFCLVPAATAIFQTHRFLLLSFINFLTPLDYKASAQQQGSTLELLPQDLDLFCTLQNTNKKLQAALKLSQKQGTQSDDED